jgi:hypothetical protein
MNNSTLRIACLWAATLFAITLAACGGGSGGGSGNNAPPTVSPTGSPSAFFLSPHSANSFSLITLNGNPSTDTGATITAYKWSQTSGPAVTLSSSSGPVVTFVAPNVTIATSIGLSLEVTDSSGATSSPYSASISINPAPAGSIGAQFISVTFFVPVTDNIHNDAAPTDAPPLIGSSALMAVGLSGAITSASFQLVNSTGTVIQPITLVLSGDSSLSSQQFEGSVQIPAQTFYVQATGSTGDGNTFTVQSPNAITPTTTGIQLTLNHGNFSPGGSMSTSLQVSNGGASTTFNVSAFDPAGLLGQPLNASVSIASGQSAAIPLTVSVPATYSGTPAPMVIFTAAVAGDSTRTASTGFTAWVDGAP